MISKAETGKNPSTARNVDSFNIFFEFFNQTDLRKQDPFLSSQSQSSTLHPPPPPFSYEIKCSTQHIKVNNKFHRGGEVGGEVGVDTPLLEEKFLFVDQDMRNFTSEEIE